MPGLVLAGTREPVTAVWCDGSGGAGVNPRLRRGVWLSPMRERPLVPSTFNFLSCSELAIQCEMKLEKKMEEVSVLGFE